MDLGYIYHLKGYAEKFKQSSEDFEDIIEEFKLSAESFKTIFEFLQHIEENKKRRSYIKYCQLKETTVHLLQFHF